MKSYIYIEHNGNAVIYLSEENREEADKSLKRLVKDPEEWRFDDEVEDDDDGEMLEELL